MTIYTTGTILYYLRSYLRQKAPQLIYDIVIATFTICVFVMLKPIYALLKDLFLLRQVRTRIARHNAISIGPASEASTEVPQPDAQQ